MNLSYSELIQCCINVLDTYQSESVAVDHHLELFFKEFKVVFIFLKLSSTRKNMYILFSNLLYNKKFNSSYEYIKYTATSL